jgi:hypothetical protein
MWKHGEPELHEASRGSQTGRRDTAVIAGRLRPPIIGMEVDREFAFPVERSHRVRPGHSFRQQTAANN